jgi:GMP synthase (glutamine-hydrolysing)
MKKLIIIKAGSTFPIIQQSLGDFDDWVISGTGVSDIAISVVNVAENEELPPIDNVLGVIMTGSHAMVTDRELWMQTLEVWLREVFECNIPLLGICFGHQILAVAMGGHSDYHPKGREVGTVSIHLTPEGKQDRLLGFLPDDFLAHTTHAQTIIRLPANAVRLADNSFEINHAFRLGDYAWGVQFHPEFTADIMRAYVAEQSASLTMAGYDIAKLNAAICNTYTANMLLQRFMAIVKEQV